MTVNVNTQKALGGNNPIKLSGGSGDANNSIAGWFEAPQGSSVPFSSFYRKTDKDLTRNDFDFNNYKVLLEENNLIELFKIYIKLLPKIKHKNHHMHSQVKIIKNNFNIDIFINIDKKGDIMILKEKIKQDLLISNKSSDKNKQLCEKFINNDINYKNIIYDIYKDDFEILPIE